VFFFYFFSVIFEKIFISLVTCGGSSKLVVILTKRLFFDNHFWLNFPLIFVFWTASLYENAYAILKPSACERREINKNSESFATDS
jgi:hypothetical protein